MRRVTRQLRPFNVWVASAIGAMCPVRPRRVVFVTKSTVQPMGNLRIVAERLAAQPEFEVAIYKEGGISAHVAGGLEDEGVRVFSAFSWNALVYLWTSSTVVLSHSARDAYILHRKRSRRIINLWHGVALKRIELLMPLSQLQRQPSRWRAMRNNAALYDAVLASSSVDRLVNALSFGVPFDAVYPVGLPRLDYLRPEFPLPADLQSQRDWLSGRVRGRSLVVVAPTFRDERGRTQHLLRPLLSRLCEVAFEWGLAIALRPHPYERSDLRCLLDVEGLIYLDPEELTEAGVILAMASALVVDYSSIWVDFLLRQKAILGYVPDMERYSYGERGFIYSQEEIFPGPLCSTPDEALVALKSALQGDFQPLDVTRHAYAQAQLLGPTAETPSITSKVVKALFESDKAPA